jgi:hypothetical protein
VLPFPPDQFRETSVVDRPGDWGRIFDRLVAAAKADGDLVILPDNDAGDEAAYAAANAAIIREAQTLARDTTSRLLARVVWEGSARPGGDATEGFRKLAVDAGFEGAVRHYPFTRSTSQGLLKWCCAHGGAGQGSRQAPQARGSVRLGAASARQNSHGESE